MANRPTDAFGVYDQMQRDDEDLYIRFDLFARAVLESVIDQRYWELSDLYNALRLKIENAEHSARITLEEFKRLVLKSYPRKSSRWAEIAYRAFTDGIYSDQTPLASALLRLVPLIADEDVVRENFLHIKVSLLNMRELERADKNGALTAGANATKKN